MQRLTGDCYVSPRDTGTEPVLNILQPPLNSIQGKLPPQRLRSLVDQRALGPYLVVRVKGLLLPLLKVWKGMNRVHTPYVVYRAFGTAKSEPCWSNYSFCRCELFMRNLGHATMYQDVSRLPSVVLTLVTTILTETKIAPNLNSRILGLAVCVHGSM